MAKIVRKSIEVDPALWDAFIAKATSQAHTADEVVSSLMRSYLSSSLTLKEMLAMCDPQADAPEALRQWLDAKTLF